MIRAPAPPAHTECGGVALLTVVSGMLLAAVALVVVAAATDVATAAARARTAADAAALAGAGALPLAGGDGDVASAAVRLAEANGARLASCCGTEAGDLRAAPIVVVEVAVHPRLAALRAVTMSARAAATLRPERARAGHDVGAAAHPRGAGRR